MRKYRIFALLLAAALLLPGLVACGDGGKETENKGTESQTARESATEEAAWWSGVDFGGEPLVINVSVAISDEFTFGPADIYSRGPDSLEEAKDNVQKMVFDRNRNVEDALGLSVEWQETDKKVGESQAVLENFVKQDAPNSPDIFINDVYDLIHAMLSGSLFNLMNTDDGNGGQYANYFDFTHPSWYWEYMSGTTLDRNKIYIATGDYFVDMIRYAFALYVNREMFDEVMQSQSIDVHCLYEDVLAGYWDYDTMETYMEFGWKDTANDGLATDEDEVVGLIASAHLERVFQWTSGISMLEWEDDELYNGTPILPQSNQKLFDYVDRFISFFNALGFYYTGEGADNTRSCVELFLQNKALFALAMLGELESEQVRASGVNKGVLPMPKYNLDLQDDYHTLVHDQAEVSALLNNTEHFTEASAYLQLVNEQSVNVLKEYYDKALLLRYNDDKDTQQMIDLIHRNIGTPFDMILARLVVSGGQYLPGAVYNGKEIFHIIRDDCLENRNTLASEYDASYDGWKSNLEALVRVFEGLE